MPGRLASVWHQFDAAVDQFATAVAKPTRPVETSTPAGTVSEGAFWAVIILLGLAVIILVLDWTAGD